MDSKQGEIQSLWPNDITIGCCHNDWNTTVIVFQSLWPYDITICYGSWMCPWLRPSWTTYLFSGVQPSNPPWYSCVWGKHIYSVGLRASSSPRLCQGGGGGGGKGRGGRPAVFAYNLNFRHNLNYRRIIAKQQFVSPAVRLLIYFCSRLQRRYHIDTKFTKGPKKLYFDISI